MTTKSDIIELHLDVTVPDALPVDLLHAASGLTRQAVKKAMRNGAVWLTRGQSSRRLRRAKRPLRAGDQLHLYYDPRVQAETPPEPLLIKDMGGYSLWRKPAGMRSQGSKWGDHCTIMRWAEQHLEPERTSYTVHRLDLAANGLILVAHSKAMAAALARQFSERLIDKNYRAIVHGDLSYLREPVTVDTPVADKTARSTIACREVSADGRRSVADVSIETGRKHQIRKHLAELGHPIVGDRLYGSGAVDNADLQLTAWRLAFHCPVQDQPVEYRLPERWLPSLAGTLSQST